MSEDNFDSSLNLMKLTTVVAARVSLIPYVIPTAIRVNREYSKDEQDFSSFAFNGEVLTDFTRPIFSKKENLAMKAGLVAASLGVVPQLALFVNYPSLTLIPYMVNMVSAFGEAYRWANKKQL